MAFFPSYIQLVSVVSDASCVAIASPLQEAGPQPAPRYAMLVQCCLANGAGKRQHARKMAMNSTKNRGCYFTVLLKGTKCLRVPRVLLRVLFSQHLCFGAATTDLETGWFSELLLTCNPQWKLWFIADQTIFTQVRKDSISWLALGSPAWKCWRLLAFMPFCCNLCTLFLSIFLLNHIRHLLCILGCLQTLYMNKLLGISFCKKSPLSG